MVVYTYIITSNIFINWSKTFAYANLSNSYVLYVFVLILYIIYKFQLLELPYKGGETSLLIVLPNSIDGIHSLVEKLKDPSALNKAVGEMNNQEVNLFLPKMKIETTTDLAQVLKKVRSSCGVRPQPSCKWYFSVLWNLLKIYLFIRWE